MLSFTLYKLRCREVWPVECREQVLVFGRLRLLNENRVCSRIGLTFISIVPFWWMGQSNLFTISTLQSRWVPRFHANEMLEESYFIRQVSRCSHNVHLTLRIHCFPIYSRIIHEVNYPSVEYKKRSSKNFRGWFREMDKGNRLVLGWWRIFKKFKERTFQASGRVAFWRILQPIFTVFYIWQMWFQRYDANFKFCFM